MSIFNKMAAAWSPCGGFKTRVLHFKVKNTPLKDKNGKRKFKRMLRFLFVEERKIFIEMVLRGIQPCSLHDGTHGLFWNATKAAKFLLNFQVHCPPPPPPPKKKIYKMRPYLKWILCWICHVLSRCYLRERIHGPDSVTRIALKDLLHLK